MNLIQRPLRLLLGMLVVLQLVACFDTLTWQEEVKLSDGRVIVVTQERRFDGVFAGDGFGKPPREAWLTFRLSEFNNQEIVWHENLDTLVLNIHDGKLYLVGFPHTEREFRQYGSPKPMYVSFRYEKTHWVRIPLSEVPVAIYDSNMWFDNAPEKGSKFVSLADKEKQIKHSAYGHELKRMDPAFTGH